MSSEEETGYGINLGKGSIWPEYFELFLVLEKDIFIAMIPSRCIS